MRLPRSSVKWTCIDWHLEMTVRVHRAVDEKLHFWARAPTSEIWIKLFVTNVEGRAIMRGTVTRPRNRMARLDTLIPKFIRIETMDKGETVVVLATEILLAL